MVSEKMAGVRSVRLRGSDGRISLGVVADDEVGMLEADDAVATLQDRGLPVPTERVALADAQARIPAEPWRLLTPLVAQETWVARVTYERRRQARVPRVHETEVAPLVNEPQFQDVLAGIERGRRAARRSSSTPKR